MHTFDQTRLTHDNDDEDNNEDDTLPGVDVVVVYGVDVVRRCCSLSTVVVGSVRAFAESSSSHHHALTYTRYIYAWVFFYSYYESTIYCPYECVCELARDDGVINTISIRSLLTVKVW